MIMPVDVDFRRQAEQCYSDGFTFHGDLDLQLEEYQIHLVAIVQKHCGSGSAAGATYCFVKGLCTTDLYLSAACAKVSERAWSRFFLPDHSGRSRIASYDGRCPLQSWLRVTVVNCAARERERKCNNFESIDCLNHVADAAALTRLELEHRAGRYGPMILEAFALAAGSLTPFERCILLMRYEDELQIGEVAQGLQVNPSSITRRIERIQRKLRDGVRATLGRKGLAESAIEECTEEILENTVYAVLGFVRKASEV